MPKIPKAVLEAAAEAYESLSRKAARAKNVKHAKNEAETSFLMPVEKHINKQEQPTEQRQCKENNGVPLTNNIKEKTSNK